MKTLILVLTYFTVFSFGISQDNENAFAWFLEKEDVRPSPVSYFSKEIRIIGPDGIWRDLWSNTREYTFNKNKELVKGIFYPSYETKLDKTVYTFDTRGNLIEKSKYSNGEISETESYSFTPTNKLSCKIYFAMGSGYEYETYLYDSSDLLTKISFYFKELTTPNFNNLKNTCAVIKEAELYREISSHYTNGNKTSVIWVDFLNNSSTSTNYSYTEKGNLATEEYFDENDILLIKRTHTYNTKGDLSKTYYTSFMANSNPREEDSSTQYTYFKNGQFKSIQSFNAKGKLIFNTELDINSNLIKEGIYYEGASTQSSRYKDGVLVFNPNKTLFFIDSSFDESPFHENEFTYNQYGDLLEEKSILLDHRNINQARSSSLYTYGINNQLIQQRYIIHDINQNINRDVITETNYEYNSYGDIITMTDIRHENNKTIEGLNSCSYEYDTYQNWTRKHCISEDPVNSFEWETITTRTIVYFDE